MTEAELEELTEVLAAIEHKRWSDWQRYVHSEGARTENGDLLLPARLVDGWERQMDTAYANLTEAEKESDRKQVRSYLPLVLKRFIETQ
jgi:hypothetical protein